MARSAPPPPANTCSIVRGIALFEASKGALVFLAGFGALSLLHKDIGAIAAALLTHFHLNPAKHYPSIFLDAAGKLTDAPKFRSSEADFSR